MKDLSLDRATFGPLGFGSAVLGNLYAPISDAAARDTTRAAVELGFQYFDTAPHYGFGLSETRLGAALHELDPRQELIVSTQAGRKLVPRSGVQPGQQRRKSPRLMTIRDARFPLRCGAACERQDSCAPMRPCPSCSEVERSP